jgi:hypothetical protein
MSIAISVVIVALSSNWACAQRTEPTVEPQKLVTVAELAAKPEAFVDKPVSVRGRLENIGQNYFRDRRIVLTDAKGRRIDVRPWLPLSRPPAQAQAQTGGTLAEFLDHQVELVGSLVKRTEPNRPGEYIFQVTSAKILDA